MSGIVAEINSLTEKFSRTVFRFNHGRIQFLETVWQANLPKLRQFKAYIPEFFIDPTAIYGRPILVRVFEAYHNGESPAAVPCLLSLGCSPNQVLHLAILACFDPATYLFMTYGADLESENTHPYLPSTYLGKTAVELANQRQQVWLKQVQEDLAKQPFRNIPHLQEELNKASLLAEQSLKTKDIEQYKTLCEQAEKLYRYYASEIASITILGSKHILKAENRKTCQEAYIAHYHSLADELMKDCAKNIKKWKRQSRLAVKKISLEPSTLLPAPIEAAELKQYEYEAEGFESEHSDYLLLRKHIHELEGTIYTKLTTTPVSAETGLSTSVKPGRLKAD